MEPIVIDGAQGEGGGQVLRTSLALAAHLGRPLVVEQVRAKRSKPGLLRQHLTALRAVATICGGTTEGAVLRSDRVALSPGPVRPGAYHFAVGTAGSAMLVLQTVLWPLALADGPSRVVLEGGTHNPMAPAFEFMERTFFPVVARMGVNVRARLEKHGFFPAGGGRVVVDIQPARLRPLRLEAPGRITKVEAEAIVAELPRRIGERELAAVRSRLDLDRKATRLRRVPSQGPGNAVVITVHRENVTETFTAFGDKGRKAEHVAEDACAAVEAYLASDRPVGEHLADQLVIPLALAGGSVRCMPPSLHTRTNVEVVRQLLGPKVTLAIDDGGARLTGDGG